MTQEQLAERSGLSYKFIGEIERGTANPTVATLERLATALGVEVWALVMDPTPRRGGAYQISRHELSRVREALESIADVTDRLGEIRYPRVRRRRRA
jgi:transcriptional regulator with XRE-family HTH domain